MSIKRNMRTQVNVYFFYHKLIYNWIILVGYLVNPMDQIYRYRHLRWPKAGLVKRKPSSLGNGEWVLHQLDEIETLVANLILDPCLSLFLCMILRILYIWNFEETRDQQKRKTVLIMVRSKEPNEAKKKWAKDWNFL